MASGGTRVELCLEVLQVECEVKNVGISDLHRGNEFESVFVTEILVSRVFVWRSVVGQNIILSE